MVKRKREESEKVEERRGEGEREAAERKPLKKPKREEKPKDKEQIKETKGDREGEKKKKEKKKKAAVVPSSNWAVIAKRIGVDPHKSVVNQHKEASQQQQQEESLTREKKHLLDIQAKAKEWLSSADPLPHSDSSLTKHLALDCEMVGVGEDGKESILAEVAIVNTHGTCVYHSYVKPTEFVTNWRTKVSGITPRDMLEKGKDFNEVQREVSDIIQGVLSIQNSFLSV